MGCKLLVGQHWSVCSPDMIIYPQTDREPAEHGACYVEVIAMNRPEARNHAIHMGEMFPWVDQQRGDNKNPFSGLIVRPTQCEHGVCWVCEPDPVCDLCIEESERKSDAQIGE